EFASESHSVFIDRGIRCDCFYDFHEFHDRNRIEEVQADKALWTFGRRGDFGDGQRRRVAGENCFLGTKTVQGAEKLALCGKLLNHRFDHQIAILSSSLTVVPFRRPRISLLAASVIALFSTSRARFFSIPLIPLSTNSGLTSLTSVGKPAAAHTCAIP